MVDIEFQYYDKTTCKRCISTDKSVKLTLRELKKAIKNTNIRINFKERKLPESKIHLSPSILIDGKDAEKVLNKNSKLKTNECSDCCHLTSQPVVNCRTFNYKGENYDYMPKEMITEAINLVLKTR
ncbi:DUF2703 domain-containing protein [Candidatus Woesearchaeota archaeon]|nr:DUF2703 domain-containing protein [Candidatus Woesearchaeota archaeon]